MSGPAAPPGDPAAPPGDPTAPHGDPAAPQGDPTESHGDPVAPSGDRAAPHGAPAARAPAFPDRPALRWAPAAGDDRRTRGRALLRALVAELAGEAAAEIVASCPDCARPHGRPTAPGSGLHVSLAHCAAGSLAVAAGVPVGVDVEGPADEATLDAIQAVAGVRSLRHWTAIEAVLKADGRGLRVDPREVRIDGDAAELDGVRYRLLHPEPGLGLTVTVAVAELPPSDQRRAPTTERRAPMPSA